MGLLALVIGGMQGNALLTIKLFGLSGIIMYVYFSFKIMLMSGNSLRSTIMVITEAVFKAIPYIVPLLVYVVFVGDPIVSTIIAIITGIIFGCMKANPLLWKN